jgi:hypothetical protein
MSRPRFLADNDLNQEIVSAVLRREGLVEFRSVRDFGLEAAPDEQVIAWAAEKGFIVVSHDVNTMRGIAYDRIARGEPVGGLFLAHQQSAVGLIAESLILIWAGSEHEEWHGQVEYLPI